MSVRSNIIKRLFATALIAISSLPINAEEVILDRIVAIVHDDVVMASELENRTNDIYARLQESGTDNILNNA